MMIVMFFQLYLLLACSITVLKTVMVKPCNPAFEEEQYWW